MKRSSSIRLVLIGSLSAGALAGCGPSGRNSAISQNCVYTNNCFVPGVGYYHAPFQAWYPLPYNHFDSASRRYFFGGQWAEAPHRSITNISPPTVQAVQTAQAALAAQASRSTVWRGGFGHTSHHYGIHS